MINKYFFLEISYLGLLFYLLCFYYALIRSKKKQSVYLFNVNWQTFINNYDCYYYKSRNNDEFYLNLLLSPWSTSLSKYIIACGLTCLITIFIKNNGKQYYILLFQKLAIIQVDFFLVKYIKTIKLYTKI